MTIHLVYPHEDRISCPDAIGRHLADGLSSSYEVRLHPWDGTKAIVPAEGDVLLGHPHPSPWTTFRRSLDHEGWARRLILAPYNHGDPRQVAWLDPVVASSDLFLAITGDHWFATAPTSLFSHWVPKMVQIDLAVDVNEFPEIKTTFNDPGRRRFLFIGHSTWTKNVGYLSEIARGLGEGVVSWMGLGPPIPGVRALGLQDFRLPEARELVAEHDFLLSVGNADANPASVLEAMAWGLVPAASKESAHADLPGIVDVPLDDVAAAIRVLQDLQEVDGSSLLDMQRLNRMALEERFNWGTFTRKVVAAIEEPPRRAVFPASPARRLELAYHRLRSPYAWWRPSALRDHLRRSLRPR